MTHRIQRTLRALAAAALSSAALAGAMAAQAQSTGGDWPMWGGTPSRNMVSPMKGLPILCGILSTF